MWALNNVVLFNAHITIQYSQNELQQLRMKKAEFNNSVEQCILTLDERIFGTKNTLHFQKVFIPESR